MPFYLKLESVTGDVTDNYIFDGDGKDDLATYQPDPAPAGQPITFTASVDGSIYSFDGDGFDFIDTSVDTGETTMSGVKGPDGRIYWITITAAGSTDDLDLAASTADADAFIDERYSFNFDGIPPAPDATGDGIFPPIGPGGWLIGDGLDAVANFIPGRDIESLSTAPAEDSVHLIGASDALVASDFFLV